ncbi:cytochrome b/b6 domain-containing protein [Thalassovita sp.]|jgi:cytochrome b561/polyisoprenoid-binding protein YceI|uniref:cytochrome b/b6 domain-containing protein n=1 Tax=Thalassovita sp. TaxID=1979401 RepID=UPI003B5AD0DE
MNARNTFNSFGRISRLLHWTMALLILAMIPLGFVAENMAHAINAPGAAPTDSQMAQVITLFSLHKTTGVLVFFLALIRLVWMLTQPKPVSLHPENKLENFAAELVHYTLYGALVLVPLSGWLHHAAATGFAPIWWPFGQTLPFVPQDAALSQVFSVLHFLAIWVLIGALALHIAGTVKHHLIDKDSTLLRMARGVAAGQPGKHSIALPVLAAMAIWVIVPLGAFAAGWFATGAQTGPKLEQVASDWQVQDGSLNISILQMGNTVQGSFADWTAQISYAEDTSVEKNGEVTVTIAIPSLTLGSVTQQAMGPDYFDAAQFATAVFQADLLRRDTGLVAEGTLTIKDISIPLSLPFTLEIADGVATASGSGQVNRLDYGMGKTVTDAGTLAFEVTIDFALTATRS